MRGSEYPGFAAQPFGCFQPLRTGIETSIMTISGASLLPPDRDLAVLCLADNLHVILGVDQSLMPSRTVNDLQQVISKLSAHYFFPLLSADAKDSGSSPTADSISSFAPISVARSIIPVRPRPLFCFFDPSAVSNPEPLSSIIRTRKSAVCSINTGLHSSSSVWPHVQCLLSNAVQLGFASRPNRLPINPFEENHLNVKMVGPLAGVGLERFFEPKVVKYAGTQLKREEADLRIEQCGDLLKPFNPRYRDRVVRADIAERRQLKPQGGRALAELVMNVTSNAFPFGLLRRDDAVQQLNSVLLAFFSMFDLAPEQFVRFAKLFSSLKHPQLEFVMGALKSSARRFFGSGRLRSCIAGKRLAHNKRHHYAAG